MKFAKFSGADKNGKIYIDCSECDRGVNGSAKDKCSAAPRYKTGGHGMCFLGTLIDGLEIKGVKKVDKVTCLTEKLRKSNDELLQKLF